MSSKTKRPHQSAATICTKRFPPFLQEQESARAAVQGECELTPLNRLTSFLFIQKRSCSNVFHAVYADAKFDRVRRWLGCYVGFGVGHSAMAAYYVGQVADSCIGGGYLYVDPPYLFAPEDKRKLQKYLESRLKTHAS